MRLLRIALVMMSLVMELSAQSVGKRFLRPSGQNPVPISTAVTAGGLIYVSGTIAADGDITAQTKQVFENLRGVLQRAGSSLDHVAHMNVLLRNPSDSAAMDAVYRTQFTGDPPARTVIVSNIFRPTGLIMLQATAIPNGGPRTVITPSGWMKPTSPYSYAIQSGDTLFLSTMQPRNYKDFSPVPGDIVAQVNIAMGNAAELLTAAGMSLNDTVASRVLIRDGSPALNQPMDRTYGAHWQSGRPTRMRLRSGTPGPFDFEVTFVAIKGSSPREIVIPPSADGTPGREGPTLVPAIKVGNRLYLSGVPGLTESNVGDIKAQTTESLMRLSRTLKAAGFEFKDVVHTEVELTDVSKYDGMNEAYRTIFPIDHPARTVLGVAALADKNALIEIGLMAVK